MDQSRVAGGDALLVQLSRVGTARDLPRDLACNLHECVARLLARLSCDAQCRCCLLVSRYWVCADGSECRSTNHRARVCCALNRDVDSRVGGMRKAQVAMASAALVLRLGEPARQLDHRRGAVCAVCCCRNYAYP